MSEMTYTNQVLVYGVLLFCSLTILRPASTANLPRRKTRRSDIQIDDYTCSSNRKENKNHPTGAPTIVGPTYTNIVVVVDRHVDITCTVRSNPAANITWLYNGKPLYSDVNKQDTHTLDKNACNQKLVIQSAQIQHSGTYTCIASNVHGTVNETCSLTVYAKTRRYNIINRGMRLMGSSSGKAVIGLPLNMSCEMFNVDLIYWKKDGVRFPPPRPWNASTPPRVSKRREKVGANGFVEYLFFSSIVEKDKGNYSCIGRDVKYSESLHSYKYLETVATPFGASRQSSSSIKQDIPSISVVLLLLVYMLLQKTMSYSD